MRTTRERNPRQLGHSPPIFVLELEKAPLIVDNRRYFRQRLRRRQKREARVNSALGASSDMHQGLPRRGLPRRSGAGRSPLTVAQRSVSSLVGARSSRVETNLPMYLRAKPIWSFWRHVNAGAECDDSVRFTTKWQSFTDAADVLAQVCADLTEEPDVERMIRRVGICWPSTTGS